MTEKVVLNVTKYSFTGTVHERPFQPGEPLHPGAEWLWRCSCGARGRWTIQSPNAAQHRWRAHVNRKHLAARRSAHGY